LTASAPPLKRRIALLDELRGFCILAMILHHALFDMVFIFSDSNILPLFHLADFLRPPFVCIFVGLSGLSSRLSRSNWKRGSRLLLIALAITGFTLLFIPNEAIYFGILHLLAVCMLLFALLRPLLDKIPPLIGMIACAVFFICTYNIGYGQLGIPSLLYYQIPQDIMNIPWLFPFGLNGAGIRSADYYPLFPWVFMFLGGSFLGVWAKAGKFPETMYKVRCKFLAVVGKYTLWVYMLHQPVVYGILWAVYSLIGK
jgi:uncharacterized membrane protein